MLKLEFSQRRRHLFLSVNSKSRWETITVAIIIVITIITFTIIIINIISLSPPSLEVNSKLYSALLPRHKNLLHRLLLLQGPNLLEVERLIVIMFKMREMKMTMVFIMIKMGEMKMVYQVVIKGPGLEGQPY